MTSSDGPEPPPTGSWSPDFSAPVPHGVFPAVPGVRIDAQIGRGGYATVYRARQLSVDRDVAVKVDDRRLVAERDKRRFTREIVAAGAVSAHPHIVTVYDGGTTSDDHPFLVMELYPGGSYSDRMRESGPVPMAEVIEVGIGIADALRVAHADGILHRDVKPGNILVSRYGTPALADFGLAAMPRAAEGFSVTMESLTPSYAPPEAFSGAEPTVAMDIYSLGATLYALLLGRAPRSDRSGNTPPLARLLFLLNDPLPRPEIPGAAALMPVIWRATTVDPAQRYRTAAEFRDALKAVRSGTAPEEPSVMGSRSAIGPGGPGGLAVGGAVGGPPTGPATETSGASRSHGGASVGAAPGRRWWWVGAAAAVVALVVAGLVILTGRSTTGGEAQAGASVTTTRGRPSTTPGTVIAGVPVAGTRSATSPVAVVPLGHTTDVPTTKATPSSSPRSSSTATDSSTASSTAAKLPPTRRTPTTAPAVGSCWSGLVDISGQATSEQVACSAPHFWEAYAIGVLAAATASATDTDVLHDPVVARTCTESTLKAYLGPDRGGTFNLDVLPPTAAAFADGHKGFACLASCARVRRGDGIVARQVIRPDDAGPTADQARKPNAGAVFPTIGSGSVRTTLVSSSA